MEALAKRHVRANARIEQSDIALVSASCLKVFVGKVPSDAYATAGTRQNAETIIHDKIPIDAIVLHPAYLTSNVNKYNDVAIVKFSKALKFSEQIQPACLPATDEQMAVGSRGTAFWWGNWSPIDKPSIDHLSQTSADLVSNDECYKAHKAKGLIIDSAQTQFCAKIGSAYYAYGSPYFLSDERGHTLEGLHSMQNIMDESSADGKLVPYFYTRVANYVDWIREQAQKLTAVRG